MFNHVFGSSPLIPRTRVSYAVSSAFDGNPFGWAQHRTYNKGNVFEEIVKNPVTLVTEPFKALDREVLQPLYREVIKPVGNALEKVGQGIANDPITFIAQVAAIATQQYWALPVIAAASTAAHGGDFEQIITATAISAATAYVGANASGWIMNGLSADLAATTGVAQCGFAVAGETITANTAQIIAQVGTGMSIAAVSATGAAIQGKDPLMAAIPAIAGTAAGVAVNQLAQMPVFQEIGAQLNNVGNTLGATAQKALTGVASAAITGMLAGKDMSVAALNSLAGTVLEGLTSSVNVISNLFTDESGNITKMGAATQSLVVNTASSVLMTALQSGKASPDLQAKMTQSIITTLGSYLNSGYDALATKVSELYSGATSAADAYSEAASKQDEIMKQYNSGLSEYLAKQADLNSLYDQQDSLISQYNAATTQSEVNRIKGLLDGVQANLRTGSAELQSMYDSLTPVKSNYDLALEEMTKAQDVYFEIAKELGSNADTLTAKTNEIAQAATKEVVKTLDPSFNEAEYKTLNNLGSGVDAFTHWMASGKDQGLPTNVSAAQSLIDDQYSRLIQNFASVQGYGSVLNLPESMVNDLKDKLYSQYGNNLSQLSNATVDSVVSSSKLPATAFLPMWDSESKTITTAKVIYDDGKESLVNVSTVLPESKRVATFQEIHSGNANLTKGSNDNWYWTMNSGEQTSAMLYDASTGEIVKSIFAPSIDKSQIPEGATNVKYDEQGNVFSYTSSDGVVNVVVSGVDSDKIEYKDYGTSLDEVDPMTQMFTYSNVDEGVAANFNIQGIVQASKEVADYFQKDATDLQKLQVATVIKSGSSVLQDVGTVIGDLSVAIGLSKSGDNSLAQLGKQLQGLSEAKTPEQYKAAMADIDAMRKAASGTDIVKVNAAIAEKYPDLVGVSVFGGELFEEFIQSGLGKATGAAAGALALTLGAPAAATAAIAGVVGYGASMAMDYAESYRGAKEEMYTRMLDVYKGQGYSDAQAAQMADAAASKAGVVNGMITLAVNGIAPGDLNKVLFGGKANPAQQAMMDYFLDKVKTAGVVAASEFGQGLVEGTLQGAYNESLVYSVDPSKADYWKGIADSAMLESVIGSSVSAGTYGAANSFEAATKTFTLANEQFTEAITSGNVYTIGELGSVMKQWGVPASVSFEIVPDIIESNPNLLNAYSTPAELSAALTNSFGFDAAQAADIANIKFNDAVTTQQEAKDALFGAGLTNVTDQDAIASGVVGVAPADQATKVSDYANQQMVTEAELQAAAKQQNYTYTQAELDKLVGRGVEADVIAKFVAEIDPKAVTTEEATQYFKDLGYTKADAAVIAGFVKSAPEAEMQAAVATYVDPRQVTRQEAIDFFAQRGYVPTEAEINQYVVQGPDIAEETIAKNLGEYVDPRYVDAEEVRAAYKAMGLNAPVSASDVLRLSGQYAESELAGKAKEALPVVSANAVYALMAGDAGITETVKQELLAKIDEYKNIGMSGAEANRAATQAVAAQLGTTKDTLLSALGATEDNLIVQIGNTKTELMAKIEEYKNQGMSQAEANAKAVQDVATQLGTTKEDLLGKLGATESNLTLKIADTKTELLDKIEEYKNLGFTQSEALKKAIDDVSANLGTTKTDLLSQIGATETNLLTKLLESEEKTSLALDLTKNELTQEINQVADLVGKPAQDVTQADLDYIRSVVAGTAQGETNLGYDVNRDGKIDAADQTAIENQFAIQQNQNIQQQVDPATGQTVYVDTTTGQTVDYWEPAAGTPWAATGIYAELERQKAQAAATAKAQAAKAKTAQQQSQFGQLMGMLFQAPDAAGQQVSVKAPDPAKIGYIYDFSSIFANPSQASMMPSPYGPMNTVAPKQPQQAANQPLFQLASGFAEGGIVNSNDIQVGGSMDDLINILKGN